MIVSLNPIDEELNLLDKQLRRLKIEYEVFFNNPSKRLPNDVEWKVVSLIRKFSDGGRMNLAQRYRYNEMAQRYAIQSDLWRKKMRIREEGYRRPQDAILSIQGVRMNPGERRPSGPRRELRPQPGARLTVSRLSARMEQGIRRKSKRSTRR